MSCVYKKQNFEEKNALILKKFNELRDKAPEKLKEPLKLSILNILFVQFPLEDLSLWKVKRRTVQIQEHFKIVPL